MSYCKTFTKSTMWSRLRTFPQISKSIITLILFGTAIEKVPCCIDSFSRLTSLSMTHCKSLKNICPNIFRLTLEGHFWCIRIHVSALQQPRIRLLVYVYSSRMRPPPKEVSERADDNCCHVACRLAVVFIFKIPEFILLHKLLIYIWLHFLSTCICISQRHLLDVIDKVVIEDTLVILKLANIVKSDLDIVSLDKSLLPLDKRVTIPRDVAPSLTVAAEELKEKLLDLENRVALAQRLFPTEAQAAMEIAQMKGTCEFIVTSHEPDRLTGTKRTSPDVKIAPFKILEEHQSRLKALSKTVELGKRFFPRCSAVLDQIMDCEDLTQLACGEEDTPETRLQKKQRYMEIQATLEKAFSEDNLELGKSSLTASSSSTSKSTGGKRSKSKLFHRRR